MNPKEYFDKAAETWDEKFLTPRLSSLLEKLVPQFGLTSGQTVLDVGTGTGVLIPYIIKEVGSEGSITAIDMSPNMVQRFKTKHGHIKNVNIKVGNIEENQFPAESFDAVICFGVFPHLNQKQKALQNINSALKPEGKIVISHALSSKELAEHHKKVSTKMAHALLPNNTEMVKLLEETGFGQVRIVDEPGCYLCTATRI
jgi:ubiquinone/menaquinone biosynthesis C-methylase UbiE